MSSPLVIMRVSCPLFESKVKATALAVVAMIMVALLPANLTITNAQQQQEQMSTTGRPATPALFESAKDSFRVQLPEGWVIQDVNNTGFTLAAEVLQGYGVLAQLCPEGEGAQQQGGLTNLTSGDSSCQQEGQEEIIHILRYPNLGTRLGITLEDVRNNIPGDIVRYHNQKLQEVGYRDIEFVNSTRGRININYTTAEGVPVAEATIPARIIEMTYSTSSAPNETRRGYLILTATNVTPPGPETITGYSIFYEGTGLNATQQTTTTPSGNLSLPSSFRQISDSFELIASEEAGQIILALLTPQAMGNGLGDQVEGDEDEGDEDEGDEDEGE
jgi:hypothetical protein